MKIRFIAIDLPMPLLRLVPIHFERDWPAVPRAGDKVALSFPPTEAIRQLDPTAEAVVVNLTADMVVWKNGGVAHVYLAKY